MNSLKKFIFELQEITNLIISVFTGLFKKPFYIVDLIKQMDIIGVGSLPIVLLTGFFTGGVLILQTFPTLAYYSIQNVAGRSVATSLMRELGPVLTALMVSGRIGSAISAELGSMVVSQQIDAMRALGTDPNRKLVAPRLLALILMLPLLTVAADIFGILGGGIVASFIFNQDWNIFFTSVRTGITIEDIIGGIIKPIFFGLIIGSISCYKGLTTTNGTVGVGRSTTSAVVLSSIVVIVFDFFFRARCKRFSASNTFDRQQSFNFMVYSDTEEITENVEIVEEELEPQDLEVAVDEPERIVPAIEFRDIHLSFDDTKILNGISFIVRRGETKIILGRSGGGKSTIIRLILGLIKPDSGQILIDGENITNYTEVEMMEVRRKMGMVFQDGALFDSLPVYDNVAYRLHEQGIKEVEVENEVRRMLRFVNLEEAIDKMPAELSGGMRRRVGIARALIGDPQIVMFDEPTAGLDPPTARQSAS
jgi:ABC transport permease subunit